ncbi:DUF2300 domain-containing protein [Pseudoduganella violaceinigra]|uniref:DUF2300 domain-containing protein n=1 Tax=Pseudoduganella violaceinigra TaxID=246602 RepID=UPI0003FBD5F7|nr:DUF2300 domain-containing protein [Pseudoduganella violaceinigra]
MLPRLLPALLLACAAPVAAAASLDLAWWRDGKVQALQLQQRSASGTQPMTAASEIPLGSLWKLFVYVYAVDSRLPTPDYNCGGHKQEEVYCCDAGGSIGRDAALAQSCGLFFAPERLGIAQKPWQDYWTRRLGSAPAGEFAWLADPARLEPGRQVTLGSLLRALANIPPASRSEAEAALLRVVLDGRGAGSVRWFGSQLRVKTYSWHQAKRPQDRLGGAAGWLADGTPVWFGGNDSSSGIFLKWAPQIAAALPPVQPAEDSGCVVVDYFARYPVRAVSAEQGLAPPGALNGRYVVQFENGKSLPIRSNGELVLAKGPDGKPQLRGRLGVNEYVARVIDREASAADTEAARAFAIAARSYLQQNARRAESCQHITDSSATQRVSPNPASAAALAVARWTDQLVLDGAPVRYHSSKAGTNTLAWSDAVAQARAGKGFDSILAAAYPGTTLATAGNSGTACTRLEKNEQWLAYALPRWERMLRREDGYEAPAQRPAVCALASGAPYSEQSRNRIFMRPLATREDRITLAHEYLHIGLRRHPRGQDEDYVERLARRLNDLSLEAM